MDQIVYVCVDSNGKYLGTFATRALAESSFRISYSAITDNLRFETWAGSWKVFTDREIGSILCEVARSQANHL